MKLGLAIFLCAATVAQAAPARAEAKSPFLGTWALNVETLPLPPQQRPKSVTMTFGDAGAGKWASSVEIVTLDGKVLRSSTICSLDGTPAAMNDNAEYDHVAVTTPAPNVLIMALSKNGTPGTTRVFTVSPDGSTDIETHVYQTSDGPLSMKTAEWKRVR